MVRNVSIPGVGWGAIVVAVGAMLCSPSVGRAQNLHWVQQFGTPGFDQALATAVDSAGDVYVVGRTRCARGDAYSVGCDAFVHKYDHKGALLWSDVFGSPDEDQATGVAVDDHGYAYVVGHTAGTLPDQSSLGVYDAFLRKYSPDGQALWTRQYGGSNQDWAMGVAVARDGDTTFVYVAGVSWSYLPDFSGTYDLVRFDSDGRIIWGRSLFQQFGGRVGGVAVTGSGDVVVAGRVFACLGANSQGCGAFVQKFDRDGAHIWTRDFGPVGDFSSTNAGATGVAADGAGNIYVTGWARGPVEDSLSSAGAVVRKYDGNGSVLWTDQFGRVPYSEDVYQRTSVAYEYAGSVYVAGYPGDGEFSFVRKYSQDGVAIWYSEFGAAPGDMVEAVAVDGAGSAFVSGQTVGDMPGFLNAGEFDAFVARLSGAPPISIQTILAPTAPVLIGTPIEATALFQDPDPAGSHSAIWNWGDRTIVPGTISEISGSGSVAGSHAYASPGVYTLRLAVTDDDGGSRLGEASFEYVVVYDPEAGRVSGGGTIASPYGAYLPDPTVQGDAVFGFVTSYRSGASTPDGSVALQIRDAGLSFRGAGFDWLVISGNKAELQGSGILNGRPCKFLLAVIDGGGSYVDRFRLRIWDEAGIIYDTQLLDPATADPSIVLASGNVILTTN